jgi:hypothetical protein
MLKWLPLPGFLWICVCLLQVHAYGRIARIGEEDSIDYIKQARLFIQQVKINELKDSSFVLEDRPSSLAFPDCLKNVLEDTMSFSRAEMDFISKKAKNSFVHFWTDAIFPGKKIISSDTIQSIFEDRKKGWQYVYKHIGTGLHEYSPPIFIRKNTYCLFYYGYRCGGKCGEGSLRLYKKEGDQWKEVKSYCDWIS